MADKFPLILNTSANQIQEIASGDNLDLTGCGINNAGVITATSFSGNGAGLIGVASTDYILTGTAATFTGGVDINSDLDVDGHTNLDNVSVAGVITATSFVGSGANLTGIDATSIKDPGGNVKVQAQASGAMHTGISTFGDIDVDGHTNLDNVSVAGVSTLTGDVSIGSSMLFGNSKKAIFGDNAGGYLEVYNSGSDSFIKSHTDDLWIYGHDNIFLAGTTSNHKYLRTVDGGAVFLYHNNLPKFETSSSGITVTGGVTATTGTFSGNVSIGGTLTYEDVTNIDSVGLITARSGITVQDDATFNGATTNMVWDKSDSTLKFNNILKIYNKDGSSRIEGASGGMFFKATGAYVWSNNSLSTRFEALDASCILYANGGKVARSRPSEFQVGNPDAGVGVAVTIRTNGNALFGSAGIVTFSGTETYVNRLAFPQSGYNVVIGNMAGTAGPSGDENVMVGYGAGKNNTAGKNVIVGCNAGKDKSGGNDNTIVGFEASAYQTTAVANTVVGYAGGGFNKTGNYNTAIGYEALKGVYNNANYTKCVGIGYEAGQIVTSSSENIIVIGYQAEPSSATVDNEITLGDGNITRFRIPGIGIDLTGPIGISTEQVTPSSGTATINLAKDDHKIVASGTYTISCTGTGTEANAHTIRVENSGISTVGFSTYFKFPSGGTPSLPTASGAISLISFTVHKTGAVGIATVLLAGASVNFS